MRPAFLFSYFILVLSTAMNAQLPYNHRFENGEIQAFGQLLYELDDTYLGIG